jgi:metal-responsive CopG/Arc/MetJ family transcriptional regulator
MRKTNTTTDGKIKISINIPERLLIEVDSDRAESKQDRSNWITSAIMQKLVIIKKEK